MAVEGYQGYVAPIQGGTSYADALQSRIQFIQEQQKSQIAGIIENQEKKNAFRLKQLETLYGFQTNGWGQQPIEGFRMMRDKVSEKMKNNSYTSIEDLLTDISKVRDVHTYFNNHYDTVKPVLAETAKYMQNRELYPDKTVKPVDDVESYAQKHDLFMNLGMSNVQVDNELNMTYTYADDNGITETRSIFDNEFAANPGPFGPKLERNFVPPMEVAEGFRTITRDLVNSVMTTSKARAQVEEAVRTKIEYDDALKASADIMFNQKGYGEPVGDINPINVYVEEVMRNLSFAKDPVRQTSASRTTTGGGDKKETEKIYRVRAKETEVATDALNVGFDAMGPLGPGAAKETAYEYSLPDGVIDPINVADILTEDELYGITDENAKATVKTIALSDTGIILRGVLVGNKSVGDKFVTYDNPIAEEILQSLQQEYGYSAESWKNGDVYQMINQGNAGVPPVNRGIGAPEEKPQFN